MIGLDTNVVLRYLLQDDPKQTRQANKIFDQQLSEQAPGFISLVTVLEIVWVLRSLLKQTPSQVASHLERLLTADSWKSRTSSRSSRLFLRLSEAPESLKMP